MRVLFASLDAAPDADSIRAAVLELVEEPSYRAAARALAAEMRAQPTVADALPLFEGSARS